MTGTEFDAIWAALFRIRDELMRLEEAHPQNDRGAGTGTHPSPPSEPNQSPAQTGPATGQGGGVPGAEHTASDVRPSAAPRNPDAARDAWKAYLQSPEAQAAIRAAVLETRSVAPRQAPRPVHDDGTPLSFGEAVDRGGRVLYYTGDCRNAAKCGNAAFSTGKPRMPPGTYLCWDCYREARR